LCSSLLGLVEYLILLLASINSFLIWWIYSLCSSHLFLSVSMHSSSLLLLFVKNNILSIKSLGSLDNTVLLTWVESLFRFIDSSRFDFTLDLFYNLLLDVFSFLSSFSHKTTISLKSFIPLLYFSSSAIKLSFFFSLISNLLCYSVYLVLGWFNSKLSALTSALRLFIWALSGLGSSDYCLAIEPISSSILDLSSCSSLSYSSFIKLILLSLCFRYISYSSVNNTNWFLIDSLSMPYTSEFMSWSRWSTSISDNLIDFFLDSLSFIYSASICSRSNTLSRYSLSSFI